MRQAGSVTIDKDGKELRRRKPTQDHPQGNQAREADGRPVDQAAPAPAPASSPQQKKG